VESDTVRYDLTMWIVDAPEGIGGRWTYKTDLFDEKTIGRMQEHFRVLLESIVQEPEARVSMLEMLTEAERQEQALKEQKVFETNRRKFLGAKPGAVQKV
jgi:non-ribosomal peptide synthetase component F